MVLSLAFILAFIGSAIALLVGILIFSEVTEAMALTLPELFFPTPEVEGSWFGREHCPVANCSNNGDENRIRFEVIQGTGTGGVGQSAQMNVFHSASVLTDGYIGKVFDIVELDGKEITIEISQGANNNSGMQARIYDGELDPNLTGACGTDCFPLDSPIVTSGSGGFVTLFTQATGSTGVLFKVATPNLSSFNSPTGKVTLVIVAKDTSGSLQIRDNVYSVDIQDEGKYLFRNDPADPLWNGTTIFQVIRGNSASIDDGYVLFASKPPIFINSETALSANDTFDNALNIGFTVIGILPVALFFALFAIFGGRTDGS